MITNTVTPRDQKHWTWVEAPPNGRRDEEDKQLHLDTYQELVNQGNSSVKIETIMREMFGKNYYRGPSNLTIASPSNTAKSAPSPVPKREPSRASTSPLSEASPVPSPLAAPGPTVVSVKADSPDSDSSSDARQPPPAAAQPQYQTFGTNPLTFDDPTIYEIRPVTDDMTDEEKKEIYCVASFPKDDLQDLIAGTPPNKDFSNAVKPNNQVQAHTFASYLDGYLRPLKEEDIGFLNERVSPETYDLIHMY